MATYIAKYIDVGYYYFLPATSHPNDDEFRFWCELWKIAKEMGKDKSIPLNAYRLISVDKIIVSPHSSVDGMFCKRI